MMRALKNWARNWLLTKLFDFKTATVHETNKDLNHKIQEQGHEIQRYIVRLKNEQARVKDRDRELKALKRDPIRHLLGSIDLADIKDPMEKLGETERKDYVANVTAFRKVWRDEINLLMKQQIEFWAMNAGNEAQLNFSRGGLNFADLLLEHYDTMLAEHEGNVQTAQEAERRKNEPVGSANETFVDPLSLLNEGIPSSEEQAHEGQ